MENIIIYPENKKQHDIITAFLEEMKIRFRSNQSEYDLLEDWQKERIETGLKDIEENKIVSSFDVHKKAQAICIK